MQKEDEYSSRPDIKEKVMAYNDAFSIADRYLKECVRFLEEKRLIILFTREAEKLKQTGLYLEF